MAELSVQDIDSIIQKEMQAELDRKLCAEDDADNLCAAKGLIVCAPIGGLMWLMLWWLL